MHRNLIEIFNLPNLSFAGGSILVLKSILDFLQLPPDFPIPVYASSRDADQTKSYIEDDLWIMFSFVELIEFMRQRGEKHFIKLLNKVRVTNVDDEIERQLKSRIICGRDVHPPNYVLYLQKTF